MLKPFDVIVIDSLWYMPHHWLIKWRGLDDGVHCVTVKSNTGLIWNPIFAGIQIDDISRYLGRNVSILRYKDTLDMGKLTQWASSTAIYSKGYDFIRQWLLGFVLGLTTRSLANNENKWTCAEFPYWLFQDNDYKLTSQDESLPMPRLFKYHKDFNLIYKGVLDESIINRIKS